MKKRDSNRISPYAYGLAENVPHWEVGPAWQLFEALSHSLAAPSPTRIREARLGLVIDLVRAGTGELPLIDEYEELRSARKKRGEKWPASSSLIEAYMSWPKVIRAAMEVHFGDGRVAHSPKRQRPQDITYSRQEIVEAFERCQREIGFAPTQWEFEEWAYVSRQIAWASGKTPRIPGLKQIRKRFGGFDDLAEFVQRNAD